jgi:hypothetical protein
MLCGDIADDSGKGRAGLVVRRGDRIEQDREQLGRQRLAPGALELERVPVRLGEHDPAIALLRGKTLKKPGSGMPM